MNENKTHQILPILEVSLNLAPHSQQDRKRRKGNQQNEDTNQTTIPNHHTTNVVLEFTRGKPKVQILLCNLAAENNSFGFLINKIATTESVGWN